jgi:dTDP-4-dehydrorhamnose reductase
MARLLVTGGAGYLGAELVRRAVADGWDVTATWFAREPHADGAQLRRLDVRDAEAVARAIAEARPDAVVHTAYRQHEDAWATNVDGSEAVARAARGARLVHLSSDLVFDGRRGRYREGDEPAPVNDYGRTKAEAERRVAAAHPEATVARTSLLYGGAEPGAQERLAARGGTFFVDEIRSPVQVGDLTRALLELLEIDAPGPLHLGGADDVSRHEFALLLGADPARVEPGTTTPDRCPDVSLDSSRARGLLRTRLRGAREVLGVAA